MKLQLKHLAPYAIHGVYVNVFGNKDIVTGIDFEHGIVETMNNNNCLVENSKIYLRQLSDLTKEIEHNGESFVPYEYSTLVEAMTANENLECLCEATFDLTQDRTIPYAVIALLFEWHFDVKGLISEGLAIDINTLEK